MLKALLRPFYRLWLKAELHHILDAIADEEDRQRRYPQTMRSWHALAAEYRHRLGETGKGRVAALSPRDRVDAADRFKASCEGGELNLKAGAK